ncbi:MAG: DUF5131 family protein [Planctomycetota bacterium]
MPLNKSRGNMYDFVTHMHSHLGGECPHKCSYCYVQKNRFGVPDRYKGEPRLIEKELLVNYGSGKTIFIEHMNDLFAYKIKYEWIKTICEHCKKYPDNKYIFQTKNPIRALEYFEYFPSNFMIGTTIETNRKDTYKFSEAPYTWSRGQALKLFVDKGIQVFVTIEPITDFDITDEFNNGLLDWMKEIKPAFINIGADSKNCNLPEPSPEKVRALIEGLQGAGLTIKKKSNLRRILERDQP